MNNRTFEEAMVRLEEIVESLEKGALGLEASMALFAEGSELTAYLENMLSEAKLKVEKLFADPVDNPDNAVVE